MPDSCARRADISSYTSSAVSARSGTAMCNTSASVWSSQSFDGWPEEVVVTGQLSPHLSAVHRDRRSVGRPCSERLEGNTLAVEQPQEVVVPGDQLGGRVAECIIVGQRRRVTVPVRAHDGQRCGALVAASGRSA